MQATTTNCKGWVAAARLRGSRLRLAETTESAAMEHDQKSHAGRCRCVLIRPVSGHGEQEPEVIRAGHGGACCGITQSSAGIRCNNLLCATVLAIS
jgi:hypothetical protein